MTQALMELGEQICIPNGAPRCEVCPLGSGCLARAQGLTDRIPNRAPKKARKQQPRTVFLLTWDGKVALRKRGDGGLLAGLWEFPGAEEHLDPTRAADFLTERGTCLRELIPAASAVHIFTHIEWHMQGYVARCHSAATEWDGEPLVWVTPAELKEKYALPTAFRAFVREIERLEDNKS